MYLTVKTHSDSLSIPVWNPNSRSPGEEAKSHSILSDSPLCIQGMTRKYTGYKHLVP